MPKRRESRLEKQWRSLPINERRSLEDSLAETTRAFITHPDVIGCLALLREIQALVDQPEIKASSVASEVIRSMLAKLAVTDIPYLRDHGLNGEKNLAAAAELMVKESHRKRSSNGGHGRHKVTEKLKDEAGKLYQGLGRPENKKKIAATIFDMLKSSSSWGKGALTDSSGPDTVYRWLLKL